MVQLVELVGGSARRPRVDWLGQDAREHVRGAEAAAAAVVMLRSGRVCVASSPPPSKFYPTLASANQLGSLCAALCCIGLQAEEL